jgi:uncharacterized protein (TIGR02118 family)
VIRLSVSYPATPGSHFDWDYYLGPHVDLANRLLIPLGMVKMEIDRGIGGFPPGTPAPHHAVGHLFFRSLQDLEGALAATAAELIADQQKYTNVQCEILISEVV